MKASMRQDVPGQPDNPRPNDPVEGGRPPEPNNDEPIPEPAPPPQDPTTRGEHGLVIGPGPDGDVRLV
jgi:hypothetical protein